MLKRLHSLREKNSRWIPISFFLLGFIFDALLLQRIDHLLTLIQQAVYLALSGLLISLEYLDYKGWPTNKYREPFLHFILGTLLNGYMIFYFKSTSSVIHFLFLVLLVVILLLNEFKRFRETQALVHLALLSLCLTSYFVYVIPIILGFIGVVPFIGALVASVLAFWPMYLYLKKRIPKEISSRRVLRPFLIVQLVFAIFYFARWIPPVPLSASYLGIYHSIQKENDKFRLSYTRSKWRFWEHGDQTFLARPNDRVYCFARIFSPARFKDELQVRWFYKDPRQGWIPSDAIPMQISGGRDEGYRGVTFKNNFVPGKWRVQVETTDDREIGRIRFKVISDVSTDPREFKTDLQ